jgi:hypothetical protein
VRLGGRNEQRDPFEDTLIAALMRAERYTSVVPHLQQRLARRPSAQDSLWLGQALAATGHRAEADAYFASAAQGWRDADPDFPGLATLQHLRQAGHDPPPPRGTPNQAPAGQRRRPARELP